MQHLLVASLERSPVLRRSLRMDQTCENTARGRWNANELDGLRALIALGTPLRQIAKQLGRTQATIAEKARQAGRAPKYFR